MDHGYLGEFNKLEQKKGKINMNKVVLMKEVLGSNDIPQGRYNYIGRSEDSNGSEQVIDFVAFGRFYSLCGFGKSADCRISSD